MNELTLGLDDGSPWVRPGGTVSGTASWRHEEDPDAIELRLFWYTRGKGTEDLEIVDSRRIEAPGPAGSRRFRFQLPEGPYSFSGTLITLAWALELVVLPGEATERVDLVVAPTPVEVDLRSGPWRP